MARLRVDSAGIVSAALAALMMVLAPVVAAAAEGVATPGLYDRPVLIVDPDLHTAPIKRADVDATGRFAVTGSDDRTVRIWSLTDGALLRTIRLPVGPGNVGKVYAVAMSPDGRLVVAGGWTGGVAGEDQIYLFNRATGEMATRIEGLPNVVNHLAFSPDGRHLAATLGGPNGLRVYDRDAGWAEIARDTDYGDDSYGAAFAPDGRLATSSFDGRIRLYDRRFDRVAKIETTGGRRPYGLAFDPKGYRLAVGYDDTTAVDLFDGRTLAPLAGPDTTGLDNGNLFSVAWSADGDILFAAGVFDRSGGTHMVVAWGDAGTGNRRELAASSDTVMTLAPLPDGGLFVVAQDPYLAVLEPGGGARWVHASPKASFRGQEDILGVSADGTVVDFGFEYGGESPARFDLQALDLVRDPPADGRTAPPDHDGLPIEDWYRSYRPTLDGAPLSLMPHEISRSLAVHPAGDRFVLGADWSLRAYDAAGEALWRRAVPGIVWGVNITGDGRLVVARYGDGTIRWHSMGDGRELLAFMPLADQRNWVAWTPEGFYAATRGAREFLRWHVNNGWDAAGEAVAVSEFPDLYRPDALALVLREMETARALGLAEIARARRVVQERTGAAAPPGARLHVLTIGVSDYGEDARHLRLDFAHRDARDVLNTLLDTQGSLYAKVVPQHLPDNEATRDNIFAALAAMRAGMAQGDQQDLAVVLFSGHGAVVDGRFYLFPYGVDTRTPARIRATALSVDDLRAEIVRLGERGRVLVLLDACRSGAAMADGTALELDANKLRAGLAAANVTVLTSSTADQVSREDEAWENGAFTEALLEAFDGRPIGNGDRFVSMTELTGYLATRVPELTDGTQSLGIELRFAGSVFVAGL